MKLGRPSCMVGITDTTLNIRTSLIYDIPPQLQMGTEKEVLEGVTETTQETT